jgi:hypothetical protein
METQRRPPRPLDANEQFVFDCSHSCILLADATLTKFEFWDVGTELTSHLAEKILDKGLTFAGLVGIGFDGSPRTRLTVELDSDVIDRLAIVFRTGVIAGCADPLERLWLLQDIRSVN